MADEITLSDDDDLLNEIHQQGTVAAVLISQEQPWLRARGSDDSVLPRTRFPLENENVFDNCQHCNMALSGCVVGGRGSHGSNAEMSLVMSCGHVLCDACKDAGRRTRQEKSDDPPLFECVICKEYGSANLLPGPDGVNQTTCQAAYCTGESFEPPVYRCVPCQRNLCEDCIPMHAQKFPEHELTARTSSMIDPKRAFTGCASHQQPVAYRCDCGEMLCPRCPYNYLSHIPGTSKVQGHKKTKMEELDLTLEDALEETIGTLSRIRSMRLTAIQKRQELEETTDRVANEVALHFNQIIIQAIQRCFDVLTSLKKLGSTHHSAIEAHLKMLDKTERQLTVGVEMDERARCRHSVNAESVAQYVRNVAYGLCKPAIEQFEQSKVDSIGKKWICPLHEAELGRNWQASHSHRHYKTKVRQQKAGRNEKISDAICAMPPPFFQHEGDYVLERERHFIEMDEAIAILKTRHVLIHPGLPVCPKHNEEARQILAQATMASTGSTFPFSAPNPVPVLPSPDPSPAVVISFPDPSPAVVPPFPVPAPAVVHHSISPDIPLVHHSLAPYPSGEVIDLPDDSDPEYVPPRRENKPAIGNDFIHPPNFPPGVKTAYEAWMQSLGLDAWIATKDFHELNERTQRKKVEAFSIASDAMAHFMAPEDPLALKARAWKGTAAYERPRPKAHADMMFHVKGAFELAPSRAEKIAALSMVSYLSLPEIQRFIPGLSRYYLNDARKYAARGYHLVEHKIRRMRYSKPKIDRWLQVVTSYKVTLNSPVGVREVKDSTGTWIQIPNTIRLLRAGEIYRVYKKDLTDTNDLALLIPESTHRKLLKVLSAERRKSLHGVDIIIADAMEVFDRAGIAIEKMLESRWIGNIRHGNLRSEMLASRQYLRTDYLIHTKEHSTTGDHCWSYALSDPDDVNFQIDCKKPTAPWYHKHSRVCSQCENVDVWLEDMRSTVKELLEMHKANPTILHEIQLLERDITDFNHREFSSRLEDTQFDLMITAPNTREIAENIGKWGEIVMTNAEDLTKPMKEVHILPSKPLDAASIVNAEGIKAIMSQEPIDAAEVPLRLHSALEHFTDLYEKRFCSDSMEMDFMTPREMPFQLGERSPLEAKMSGEEIEARYAYERLTMSRPGMHINHPKIFGGYRRIYNLVQRKQMIQKDVQDTYGRTPCLAPIWMADGNNVAKITPLGPIKEQDMRRLQQAKDAAAARATGAHSPESGPSPPLAAARNDLGPSPSTSGLQPAQPKPTVLRKKNLVFVKRAPSPPVLQPEAAAPLPPQHRPVAYGSAAPSRMGQPNILRRPMPPAMTAADGSKLIFRPATSAERVAAGVASQLKPQQKMLTDPAAGQQHRPLRLVPSPTMRRPMESNAHGRPRMYRDTSGRVHVLSAQSPRILPRTSQYQSHQAGPSGGAGRAADNDVKMEFADDELDESMEREERPPIRVDTMRVPGRNQYLDVLKNRSMTGDMPALRFTSDEEDRRITMRQQGYREHEINQVLMRERAAKMPPSSLSNLRVVVPTYRIGNGTNSYRPRFSDGPSGDLSAIGSQPKKRMLPIERAFTNMFGADGSLIPELSRRRGRPAKDDPTAPSNIIAQFRRHTTQWPPKFDEMDATEIEQLQDLINQLDKVTREEGEDMPLFRNGHGFKSEDEWLLEYTPEEREQLKAAAQEKINGAKAQGQGCFVCQLFRNHDGKPRDWQCAECLHRGRALTPLREGEVIEPPQKKMRSDTAAPPPEEEEVIQEEEGEEEEHEEPQEEESVVDLSVLFPVAPKVERRGRPRKHPKPDEPKEAAQPLKRVSREPKKRAVVEETEPAEEVVMGTTRRGRQIKMPAKLKGHEVSTASTTRRSPSEASEARSESSPFAALPHSSFTTQSTPVRASPKKKVVDTPVEMQKQIKEESPEPALPRSAMDAPRRGGRRRH